MNDSIDFATTVQKQRPYRSDNDLSYSPINVRSFFFMNSYFLFHLKLPICQFLAAGVGISSVTSWNLAFPSDNGCMAENPAILVTRSVPGRLKNIAQLRICIASDKDFLPGSIAPSAKSKRT